MVDVGVGPGGGGHGAIHHIAKHSGPEWDSGARIAGRLWIDDVLGAAVEKGLEPRPGWGSDYSQAHGEEGQNH